MKLQDKKILLTGATGGIGKEVALALANQGAKLVLVARRLAQLEDLCASLPNSECHHVLALDLTQTHDLESLNEHCRACIDGQRIDIVINNAGYNQFDLLSRRSAQSVSQEVQLNLTVPILLTQSALQWINRPGLILNVGSTLAGIGYPGYSAYCAAKSGLYRFSEALNRELDGSGIKVLYLAPRTTDTSLNSESVRLMNQQLGNHCDDASLVAQHFVQVLQKEVEVRWIGWPEKLFVRINQFLPTVVSNTIRKQQETIHHFIRSMHKNV